MENLFRVCEFIYAIKLIVLSQLTFVAFHAIKEINWLNAQSI